MATLNVTEFVRLMDSGIGKQGQIPHMDEDEVTTQNVTYTSSAQSNAFAAVTRSVRVAAVDADAYVKFGTNPTATVTSTFIKSGNAITVSIPQGESYKVAAYDGST